MSGISGTSGASGMSGMFTLSARLVFHIPQAASLKDKRQVRRSLVDRVRHRFNAAIAEIDTQDVCRTLTLGIAVVSGDGAHRHDSINEIIRYMEEHADAELTAVTLSE